MKSLLHARTPTLPRLRLLLLLLLVLSCLSFSISMDVLTPKQRLIDGETLISSLGVFELGFFTPNGSANRYLSIWYKHIPVHTVVWVANRNVPLADSAGHLALGETGNLTLTDGSGNTVWSSNSSSAIPNPVLLLSEFGNLIVQDGAGAVLWQSFDHPTDTWLFGMKLFSKNNVGLRSWKHYGDPAVGDYSLVLDSGELREVILSAGSSKRFRLGSWDGLALSGIPEMVTYDFYRYSFFCNEEDTYYMHEPARKEYEISRFVLDESGVLFDMHWVNETRSWEVFKSVPKDQCDIYGRCGAYSLCSTERRQLCECLGGFEPKSPKEWKGKEWSRGCVRRSKLDCEKGSDWFQKFTGVKIPDTAKAIVNRSLGHEECRQACLMNCSCMAFASEILVNRENVGCLMWMEDLKDLRKFSFGGQDFYVRLAAVELGERNNDRPNDTPKKLLGIISGTVSLILILLGICLCAFWIKLQQNRAEREDSESAVHLVGEKRSTDLSIFTFATIATATNKFSDKNKLGEGGFGSVYKGILSDGQEIAVKRLSNNSKQGHLEFMNEVNLIARLQHRNLVRLVGVCTKCLERMLIYEYMPNKSLDSILFDPTEGRILDWPKRKHIIEGIAQGLLYLHKYSRLRIIHRDLKASNILLDADWNPKISDFGMAKIFSGNEKQGKTKRLVGTFGYMSPEYAFLGLFSEKSDVFSFGVLLLEIVTGKRNVGVHRIDGPSLLLEHVWDIWKDGRASELIDSNLGNLAPNEEIYRCIKIGLLCVQENPEDRPAMPVVVSLLSTDSPGPSAPNQPAFYTKSQVKFGLGAHVVEFGSSNGATITMLEAR